ncbi:MAG TPA: DUF6484 domain-containing protein [Polyangiales bacterium]|nr:DUF6484 domain-containing protein [Polyangiales bacterium]
MTGRVLKLKRRRAAQQERTALPTACVGRVVGLALPDEVFVALPGAEAPVLARLGMDCDAERLQCAIDLQQPAVLTFEEGDSDRPILLGLIAPARESRQPSPTDENSFVIEADADGKRVKLHAQEEIVLQCGDSSISLKRNGRVVIRGAYVETNAAATNRIKGGSVRIN